MPELPEVETTRRDLTRVLAGRRIQSVMVRERRLRWPISPGLPGRLSGATVAAIDRRAKYLLIRFDAGTLIVHLGMSGSLRIADVDSPADRHDHFELVTEDRICVRLRDPRRFGAVLWTARDPHRHRLLKKLGPEPLESDFDGAWLHAQSTGRRLAIKNLIMNASIVAGVGNIYASEALWIAGVHPKRAAGRVSRRRYDRLADAVKMVLADAIGFGGTTLRDYSYGSGETGEYSARLNVYDRAGRPCARCAKSIRRIVIGQRASYYCPGCQR